MQKCRTTIAVIGAGPAGIACAQQCVREGVDDVLLIERDRPGGLLYQANRLENFPGLRDMSGREAVEELTDIVSDYSLTVLKGDTVRVSRKKNSFESVLKDGSVVSSTYLVLATGTKPRELGIPDEIYHPEWRDHTDEKVVVIGGGDAAYDYALRIHALGGEVVILQRGEPKALQTLVDEIVRCQIPVLRGELKDWDLGETGYSLSWGGEVIECDTVISAIGREPNLPEMDFSYGDVEFPTGGTDIDGLYAVGSLVLGGYRHASLAWGMGLAAAMDICSKNSEKM